MDAIDWKAAATLREPAVSDPAGKTGTARQGSVGELARHVARLSADHRDGLVIEVVGGRTLDLGEILELAAREDLGD